MYSDQIESLKTESGLKQEREKLVLFQQQLGDREARVRQKEEETVGVPTKLKEENAILQKELETEKAKFEAKEKQWKKERKELEVELEDLQERNKKLRRSQKESD
jgi:hypothetical protein